MIEIDRLVAGLTSTANQLRVRSALNPFLWLCFVGVVTCLPLATLFDGWLRDTVVLVGVSTIPLTCLVGVYFALTRPERLQSEDYQLRERALTYAMDSGRDVIHILPQQPRTEDPETLPDPGPPEREGS